MTTFVQGSTRMAGDNQYLAVPIRIRHHAPMTLNREGHGRTSATMNVKEARTPTPKFAFENPPPQSNVLADLITDMEGLSLFRRTTAQVFLDKTMSKTGVQFREYRKFEEYDELVPVTTLEEIKGGALIKPPPNIVSLFEDCSSDCSGSPKRSPSYFSEFSDTGKPTFESDVAYLDGFTHGGAEVHVGLGYLQETSYPDVLPADIPTATSHHQHIRSDDPLGDTPHDAQQPAEKSADEQFLADFHNLFDDLEEDLQGQAAASFVPSLDFGPLPDIHELATTALKYPHSANISFDQTLGSPPSIYPFPETPGLAALPFPITVQVHDPSYTQNEEESEGLPDTDVAWREIHPLLDVQTSVRQSTIWPGPPSLSPSYTESSQDSALYTPADGRSPISLSFASPEPQLAALAYQQSQDTSETSQGASIDIFEALRFEDMFASTENFTHNAGGVGKGNDTDGSLNYRIPAPKKKHWADKFKCEIGGCNSAFPTDSELMRHQKHLHETDDPAGYQHTLPTQELLASTSLSDPSIGNFDGLSFENPFDPPSLYTTGTSHQRVSYKAAKGHKQITVQVAPYPLPSETIPPSRVADKPKNKARGKAKATHDSDSSSSEPQAKPKKKSKKHRKDEDKVLCGIDDCDKLFFSNWELRRHRKNIHSDGAELVACPKCGREFASGRKDSLDRHIELNACWKRNPRKPPKRPHAKQP
ncbi:hypothetical protein H0H87_004838 [Tephrocybe sp. NHM501043]|nr:hypothetical protein H0H87_004838 [Tephrocybe sp. NHM501043]